MKILLAVDGSEHTRRALAYLAAHDEWLGARHAYTVVHAATALPHRAAAFQGLDVARSFYEDDAELIFKPVRQFLATHGIQATFVLRIGHPAVNRSRPRLRQRHTGRGQTGDGRHRQESCPSPSQTHHPPPSGAHRRRGTHKAAFERPACSHAVKRDEHRGG